MKEEQVIEFLRKYKGAIIGALVGIILCILWFTIGFWATLLVLAVIFICSFLGNFISRVGLMGIARFIDKIFK